MVSKFTSISVERDLQAKLKELSQGSTYTELLNKYVQAKTAVIPTGIGPLTRNSGKVQGVTYIASNHLVFKDPIINATTIREVLGTPQIQSKLQKMSLTFFPERVVIEALNPKQKVDADVTKRLQNMCEAADVRLNEKIKQADQESFVWGMGFFNPIWVRRGGEIFLQKIRHLPSWSFDTPMPVKGNYLTWSPLLRGVIVGEDGNPQYWQRITEFTFETEQITNIMTVVNPQDEGLAGDSKLLPLIQIMEMIKYCYNTEMKAVNMAGAPVFFLKITNPKGPEDPLSGGVGDIEFGHTVIRNWGQNKQFILRDNMEIIPLPLDKSKNVIDSIELLLNVIDEYFSISNMISKDGTLIGGSSIPELKLLNQAIRGKHNWLLAPFEDLLNQYFPLNGFPEGWTVKLTIPVWDEDRSAVKQKAAQIGFLTKSVDLDDLRDLLDLESADATKKKSIQDFYDNIAKAAAPDTTLTSQLDAKGKPIKTDAMGNPVDKQGNPVDDNGNPVDENGNPLDENGDPLPPKGKKKAPVKNILHSHVHTDKNDPITLEMSTDLDSIIDKLSKEVLKTVEGQGDSI